ncbi:MAG: carboxypeptidase-like regulatory domain-containing protein, partial [Chitinophagaceae bacterium]
MKPQLLILLVMAPAILHAQTVKLSGRVTTTRLEPLALVTVQINGTNLGMVTNEAGFYEFKLDEGNYQLTASMLGFKSRVITLTVSNKPLEQNIILEEEEVASLSEVVVKGKGRDRSREIIRNVIRRKDEIQSAAGAYSVKMYIKAIQDDSTAIRKKKKKVVANDSIPDLNADLKRMAMAEILLNYDYQSPKRTREERIAVKRNGNYDGLFFLSTTEGDFNFYNNLVNVPAVSGTPFLSPVSYSGLTAYRTRLVKTEVVKGRKQYTISVKPGKLSNATVDGEMVIQDSSWVILHTRFSLPAFHLPAYDFFEIEQDYNYVDARAWMITRQQFTYFSKTNKGKKSGSTLVTYTDYQLGKDFVSGYFGPEVSTVSAEAYNRDSSFWKEVRTEPLTAKELRFIRYRDSVYNVTHSKPYLDSIDAKMNRVTWNKLLYAGQPVFNREKERLWMLPSAVSMISILGFGGTRISPSVMYVKDYKSKKRVEIWANASYGLRNKDINGNLSFYRMYNPFNRGYYRLTVQRDFEYIFEGDAWINMIKRSNQYLDNSFGIAHGLEIANGLFVHSNFDIAFRRSLSNYKTNDRLDSLLDLDNNQAIPFEGYNASYGKLEVRYTPFQRYIREPKQKLILGSSWPTFYTIYRKGIPGLFRSKVDFDYLEFGVQQTIKLGLTGISSYTLKTGTFLTQADLRLVDYKFQRRGDPLLFLNPNEAFQSLDSTFPVFNRFYRSEFSD